MRNCLGVIFNVCPYFAKVLNIAHFSHHLYVCLCLHFIIQQFIDSAFISFIFFRIASKLEVLSLQYKLRTNISYHCIFLIQTSQDQWRPLTEPPGPPPLSPHDCAQ